LNTTISRLSVKLSILSLGLTACPPAALVAQAHGVSSPTFAPSTGVTSGSKTATLPTLFASSHAANLLLRPNGDLLCFWFSGSHEGDSNVAIVVSRLPKGSTTWEPPVLVDRQEGKSYQNPVPIEDAGGRIWLYNTSQSAGKGQADSQVLKTYSDDGGKTWSKTEVVFDKAGSYLRQPAVLGENGELLLPIYYSTSSGITNGADSNYSVVDVSKDMGKTWHECQVPSSNGLVQMSIVKRRPGSYVAFFRSRYADFIYRSTSANGCEWTKPTKTVLPNNNASIQAAGLKDGKIAIAFDNTHGKSAEKLAAHEPQTGPRAPLSVAISRDGGLTWSAVRDLEIPDADAKANAVNSPGSGDTIQFPGEEEYSYPSILQLPSGKILVAYTYRRLAIKAALFDELWVGNGTTVGIYKPSK
jgi:predicted neuraminidase